MVENQISFVICVYEEIRYLEETINSIIITQSIGALIYIVDDSRIENRAKDIALKFGERVKYFRNPVQKGASNSFNYAAEISDSEYVMIVGPDDLLLKDVSPILKKYENVKFDALQPGVTIVDGNGNPFLPLVDFTKKVIRPKANSLPIDNIKLLRLLALGNWTYNPSIIWSSEFLRRNGYSSGYKIAMDLDLLMRLSLVNGRLIVEDEVVFGYRRHKNSISMKANGLVQLSEVIHIHGSALRQKSSLDKITNFLLYLALFARIQAGLAFWREKSKCKLIQTIFTIGPS
jgi:glycosyltransferase involved in cell wall biosynthesis